MSVFSSSAAQISAGSPRWRKSQFRACKLSKAFQFLMGTRLLKSKGVGIYVEAAKMLKNKYREVRFELIGFFDQFEGAFFGRVRAPVESYGTVQTAQELRGAGRFAQLLRLAIQQRRRSNAGQPQPVFRSSAAKTSPDLLTKLTRRGRRVTRTRSVPVSSSTASSFALLRIGESTLSLCQASILAERNTILSSLFNVKRVSRLFSRIRSFLASRLGLARYSTSSVVTTATPAAQATAFPPNVEP